MEEDSESDALPEFESRFSCELFPSFDDTSYIDRILFYHHTDSSGLLRGNEGTSGSSEGIIDSLSSLGGIKNEFSKEWYGLHRWMNSVLTNFCECKNAL